MLNSTEIWEIYNETVDAHPIHLHQVAMQLLDRQKFMADIDQNGKPSNIRLIGQPKKPSADELGWKDTYVMYPGEVTRIIAHFDLPGLYVWHCHILSHEDHEMMRPFFVGNIVSAGTFVKTVKDADPSFEQHLDLQLLPNPFTDRFTMRFKLDKASEVIVNLYDIKGSLVKKVFNGVLTSGFQQLRVDGINSTSGVYYCEIVVAGKRLLRKMVLQK
jgi:spore coat protein A